MTNFPKVISICLLSLLCSLPAAVGDIEAVKGKKYTLTKQHGPWMVLVATIRDIDEKERRIEGGMTAREAADALVYELRLKKIPAYVHIHQEKVERLDENTGAAMDGRHFISQHGSISVLAGNFRSNTDEDLARLRDWIREKFNPKFLEDSKNGGLYAKTPGRPTILKPFITVNPMLSPEEVREKTLDKLVISLNSDMEHSLFRNKGKYTLVVATFSGNSILQIGSRTDESVKAKFEQAFGGHLDKSANDAWALTEALRTAKKLGYEQDFEAYVFHDRNKSVVTIGSFNDPNDPRIQTLATRFRAKMGRHPNTGDPMPTAELLTIPKNPPANHPPNQIWVPDKQWIFDPEPKLMKVPKLK